MQALFICVYSSNAQLDSMLPSINGPRSSFKTEIFQFSQKHNSNLALALRESIGKCEAFQLGSQEISDDALREWIDKDEKSIAAALLVANACGNSSLPHIQWMYINYAATLLKDPSEIAQYISESSEKFLHVFGFVRNLESYLDLLVTKYLDRPDLNSARRALFPKVALELINKARREKKFLNALSLSIDATKKFGLPFLHFVALILSEMKETNEALKALLQLTYRQPLSLDQFGLWGKISVELTSARNYFAAKLGTIIYPNNYVVLLNLSGAGGGHDETKIALKKLIGQNPNDPSTLINYANIVNSEGQPAFAVDLLKKAQRLSKKYLPRVESNLLFISQYDPGVNYDELKLMHMSSSKRMVGGFQTAPPFIFNKSKAEKLRVGYVSYDLINHPVSYYLYPVIKNLNRDLLDVSIFYTHRRKDPVTKLFMDLVPDRWYEIGEMDSRSACEFIRHKQVDVLVDLSGHTAGNRLELFSMRSAPHQCTYLGYPFTTGLKNMDYRFGDWAFPNDQKYYTEKRIDVDPCSICYQPLVSRMHLVDSNMFGVVKPPVLEKGYITYGASTNPAKVNDKVVEAWSMILKSNPSSKLLIEANGFSDHGFATNFAERFLRHGIGPERLILRQRDGGKQYLIYNEIDVALDPFPYNGGTSTLDLLWMGLPLITLEGVAGMSAAGAHMLKLLDRSEWISKNVDEYVQLAVKITENLKMLTEARLDQRIRMQGSPMMDAPAVGAGFTRAFLEIAGQPNFLG